MVYIIDTHALIWYLEGNPRLGSKAKSIMAEMDMLTIFT
jgi:PIN domain nuclease of toxin-antitoxin system